MRLVIDAVACEANGVCTELLPQVLELDDDDDTLRLRLTVVPAALEERARQAVRACPRQALSIAED